MDNHDLHIVEREFKDKASQLMLLMDYQEKFYENFLKVKLGFLAFVGVIFTVIFSRIEDFSCRFLFCFLIIIFVIFLLFIWGLWFKLQDINRAIEKQHRRTVLAKIRDIATKDNLENYGKEAERLLIEEDKIRQAMQEKKLIEEIIKYKKNIRWKIEFALWALLFLSIPFLFLLELMEFFK